MSDDELFPDSDMVRVAYAISARLYNDGRPIGERLQVRCSSWEYSPDVDTEHWSAIVDGLARGVHDAYMGAGLPQQPLHSANYTMRARIARADDDWLWHVPADAELAVQADYGVADWRERLFTAFADAINEHYLNTGPLVRLTTDKERGQA